MYFLSICGLVLQSFGRLTSKPATKYFSSRAWVAFLSLCLIVMAGHKGFSQAIQPATLTTPSVARSTLVNGLNALGEAKNWSALGRVTTTGRSDGDSSVLQWMDIRTGKNWKQQRGNDAVSELPNLRITLSGGHIAMPVPDPTVLMLPHLPGLALLQILNDSKYHYSTVSSNDGMTHVIVKSSSSLFGEEWIFNPNSGLPSSVRLLLHDITNPNTTIWQTTTYPSFQPSAGVLVPTGCSVSAPDVPTVTYTFSSISLTSS